MRRDPDQLQSREFDLAIIGAGISGACLAHDAALRGLSVALIDQRDFGSATSSASSKLLHGGIRYLQQGQPAKVRESARECAYFQRIAPHLTRYVPFLIPTYRGVLRGRAALAAGLALYERLAVNHDRIIHDAAKRVPPTRHCTRNDVARMVPALADDQDVTGAYLLHESHIYNSERMVLAFVKTAHRHGAVLANYVAADGLLIDGSSVRGILARDGLTGDRFTIRARLVANAAGPCIMKLNEIAGISRLNKNITRFSKGAHVITRQLIPNVALALKTSHQASAIVHRGGRHVFIIPWRHRSLIGTTNVPYEGEPDAVRATLDDAQGLVGVINEALPAIGLTLSDVSYAYAGLYPLTDQIIRADVYQGTGDYQIVDHARVGRIEGLISVLGAKYTTARRLAELAANMVEQKLKRPMSRCVTAETPIDGGAIPDLPSFTEAAIDRHAGDISEGTVRHLVASYGTEMEAVLASAPQAGRRLLTQDRESLEAEVSFAVRHEMAVCLADVIFRRTGLGTLGHPGRACLERCATIMAPELGWSASDIERQIQATESAFPTLTAV